jgi:uncharacterized protein YceK
MKRKEVLEMKKILVILAIVLILGACQTVEKRDPGYWGRYSAGNTP